MFRKPVFAVSRVKLYVFKAKWVETNTEGPLFLYERCGTPQRRLVVLNTQRPRDFTVDLDRNLRLSFDRRFLMIKRDFVYGIWFYSGEEFARIRGLLGRGPEHHL